MSRKVTEQVVDAFYKRTPKTVGNTHTDGEGLFLHGNRIACHVIGGTEITNCGWFSSTTKERLNGLYGVHINQDKGEWYLNGKLWDGKPVII